MKTIGLGMATMYVKIHHRDSELFTPHAYLKEGVLLVNLQSSVKKKVFGLSNKTKLILLTRYHRLYPGPKPDISITQKCCFEIQPSLFEIHILFSDFFSSYKVILMSHSAL